MPECQLTFFQQGVKMPECQLKTFLKGGSIVRNRGSIIPERGVN